MWFFAGRESAKKPLLLSAFCLLILPMPFALPAVGEITRLAERAALRLVSLAGGYDGETYDEEQSTQVVAIFENDAKC
jgi:hypothetical protein